MKKILAAVLVLVSSQVLAHDRYHSRHHQYPHRHADWAVPVIVGGMIGYGISQAQRPVIVQQPREYIPVTEPACTTWREYQYPDGTVVRERICR